MIRICVVTPQPTPYRDPFWNTVAERPDVELDVYYCYARGEDRPWDLDWPWRFRGEVLPGRALLGDHNGYWNPLILKRLRERPYDAIILGGYNHLTMLAAAWYARRKRVPYLVMCESYHGLKRATYRRWAKTPLVRWVVGNSAGILPTGQLARDYLVSYGGRADRWAYCPNVPDIEQLKSQSVSLEGQREAIRQEQQLDEKPVILFVGRLIRKKGVDVLLEALRMIVLRAPCTLVIAGDGPERESLERQVAQLGLAGHVRFVGFKQPKELPRWYCAADVFVLPSRTEPWGVVVLEALASGLPVVVTELVGCHPDVVTGPEVGMVVPAENAPALAKALEYYITRRPSRDQVHAAWKPTFEGMRYPVIAANLMRLIQDIINERQAVAIGIP